MSVQIQEALKSYWETGWVCSPCYIFLRDGKKELRFGSGGWKKILNPDTALDAYNNLALGNRVPNSIVIRTGPESGLLVIDIDLQGRTLQESLKVLIDKVPEMREFCKNTLVAQTASGGVHLYGEWTEDCAYVTTTAVNVLGPGSGVDVRGKDGLIIAPPSSLPRNQGQWVFVNNNPPLPVPTAFLSLLTQREGSVPNSVGMILTALKAKLGRPDRDTWFRLVAGTYRKLEDRDKAIAELSRVWPEEKPGEYGALIDSLKSCKGRPIKWNSVLRLCALNGIEVVQVPQSGGSATVPDILSSRTAPLTHEALTAEGAFCKGSLILFAAPPGSLKTQTAMCLCRDFSHLTHDVLCPIFGQYHPLKEHTKVLYITNDMDHAMIYRYLQELQILDPSKLPPETWDGKVNDYYDVIVPTQPMSLADVPQLTSAILAGGYELVVIDTLFSVMDTDYSDSKEVRALISALRGSAEQTRAVYVMLHHERKRSSMEQSKFPGPSLANVFGSTALTAGVDAVISQIKVESGEDTREANLVCLKPRSTLQNFRDVRVISRRSLEAFKSPHLLRKVYTYTFVDTNPETKVDPKIVGQILRDLAHNTLLAKIVKNSTLNAKQVHSVMAALTYQKYITTKGVLTYKGQKALDGEHTLDLIEDALMSPSPMDGLFGSELEQTLKLKKGMQKIIQAPISPDEPDQKYLQGRTVEYEVIRRLGDNTYWLEFIKQPWVTQRVMGPDNCELLNYLRWLCMSSLEVPTKEPLSVFGQEMVGVFVGDPPKMSDDELLKLLLDEQPWGMSVEDFKAGLGPVKEPRRTSLPRNMYYCRRRKLSFEEYLHYEPFSAPPKDMWDGHKSIMVPGLFSSKRD